MKKWVTYSKFNIPEEARATSPGTFRMVIGDHPDQVEIQILQEVEDWKDVTRWIKAKLIPSQHSSGWYIGLFYQPDPGAKSQMIGRAGFIPGFNRDTGMVITHRDFKIEKPDDATISFRVYKRNGS